MLANTKRRVEGVGLDIVFNTKEGLHDRIVEYPAVEGVPTEAGPDFKEPISTIRFRVNQSINPRSYTNKRTQECTAT